jgi:hypothetical protein
VSDLWIAEKYAAGLLNGQGGNSASLNWGSDKWYVVESDDARYANEYSENWIIRDYSIVAGGSRKEATDFLILNGITEVYGATHTTGDQGVSTSGCRGTSISGALGKSTSGYMGTSVSGTRGKSVSGNNGTSQSGDGGESISGEYGKSHSNYQGKSISGFYGESSSGDFGKSISGNGGKSTSGRGGLSISGNNGVSIVDVHGTAMSGESGEIIIHYFDKNGRVKAKIGYVGEDTILPNVPYAIGANREFEINIELAIRMEQVSIDVLMENMARVVSHEQSLRHLHDNDKTPRVIEVLELISTYKHLVT